MDRRRVLLAGGGVATVAWSAARANSHSVSASERQLFRSINSAPGALHPVVWPVMQMGSLAAVFVAAAGVRRRHDSTSALVVAAVGTGVWAGIKLVKPLVGRGRPADLLSDVEVRGQQQSGLGYPSGHAAVSLTLALVATRSRRARAVAIAAAGLTGVSRMFVGAHLPLDVVGGFGFGVFVGNLVNCADQRSSKTRRFPA